MLPKKLVFVDVETTGTSFNFDRIIEIGILRAENNKLKKTFQTLINPETRVSSFIEGMTGITQKELDRAPSFFQVKDEILTHLEDAVFVAHNARFDYGFLKSELHRLETPFSAKHLCTARLSRYLFPRFRHHDLDSLIDRFNLSCPNRHRAFPDAEVLWQFYQLLGKSISEDKLTEAVDFLLKKQTLPTNLNLREIKSIPEKPGVYIFYGDDQTPLYVGKSVNLKDRILSHFSQNDSSREIKISQQIKEIKTIETHGELGALVREASLVKKLQPIYNRQLRIGRKLTVIKGSETEGGYKTIKIENVSEIAASDLHNILGIYKNPKQAKEFLEDVAREHLLCKKILGLEKGKKSCFGYHLGTCNGACLGKEKPLSYNMRFIQAFSENKILPWPFSGPVLIEEKDEIDNEGEIFLVDQWCLIGSFKYDKYESGTICPHYELFDFDIYKILRRYFLSKKKKHVKVINEKEKKEIIERYFN